MRFADGLCGLYSFSGRIQAPRQKLDRMIDAARYRGRAESSRLIRPSLCAALSFARPADGPADDPIARTDEVVLLWHGRLDNRGELSKRLGGPPGASAEDLVARAYLRWTDRFADHLLGDFACVIIDVARNVVLLARDAMGMRPLYVRLDPRSITFASEVAQILAVSNRQRAVDPQMVAMYLADLHAPLERTFHAGILQVEPGMTWLASSGNLRKISNWDATGVSPIRYRADSDYRHHLRDLLSQATRDRLAHGESFAVSLSGGMDSSSVTTVAARQLAAAGRLHPSAIHAFSFAFEDFPESDERHISGPLVEELGITGHEISVREFLPLSALHSRQPHLDDPALIAYAEINDEVNRRAAAVGARTMLAGYRGDLVMGEFIFDYPSLLRSGRLKSLERELRLQAEWRGVSFRSVCQSFLIAPMRDHLLSHPLMSPWRTALRVSRINRGRLSPFPAWMPESLIHATALEELFANAPSVRGRDPGQTQRLKAIFHAGHMRGMVRDERECATYGMQLADVWSDRRLAEFAIAVPQRVLNTTMDPKRLVRSVLAELLPLPISSAIRKIYPQPVFEHVMRYREVESVRALLIGSVAEEMGFINAEPLLSSYDQYVAGGAEPVGIWPALCLERWLRAHFA